MACQVPSVEQLKNNQAFLSTQQLLTYSLSELALELGFALIADGAFIPIAPFIWLAIAIPDLIQIFGGGRPKFQDTQAVIDAYNQSQYWMLHALASDLAIAEKNGAPISDSNPAIQAQFSAWKQGTIESFQQQAGLTPGPQSPGYWQLQELINTSWVYSKGGQGAVYKVVQAMDCFFEVLQQIAKHPITPPPPPPPPPKPPPPPPPITLCESGDPQADEVLDMCRAVNTSLAEILAAIQQLQPSSGGGASEACCTAVTHAIIHCARELTVIATALGFQAKQPLNIDWAPLVTELQALVNAVAAYPPALESCCAQVVPVLNSIAKALGPEMATNLKPIVDILTKLFATIDVPMAAYQQWAKDGALSGTDLQLILSGEFGTGLVAFVKNIGTFFATGLNPNFGRELAENIKVQQAGGIPPNQPIHSLVDVIAYLLSLAAVLAADVGVDLMKVLLPQAKTIASTIGSLVQQQFPNFFTSLPEGVGAPAVFALKYVQSTPPAGYPITTGNYAAIVQGAMGRAGEMGFIAWAAAMIGGFLLGPWEKYWGEIAALIATAAGFEEIAERWMGPFLDAIIRNRAIQDANQKWPTRVPPGAQGLALFARRKIGQVDADRLQDFAGLDPAWRPAVFAGAYRPVQPRTLVQLFLDQPIDRPTLINMLNDTAVSDENANLMADAIIYKSVANVRNSYLSALITGYQKGVVGDEELQESLTEFNFSPQAQQYVKAHVLILRREVLAQEAESTIVPLVANGGMSPDVGLQQLEIAGLQPWLAQLKITLATTKATIALVRKELALEAKTALEEQRNATRAAVAEFQRGVINEAGLTAALTALGLDPVLIASVVAVQDATRTGRMKFLYGQLLSPADARLLVLRIAAIAQQTKDQLITLAQAGAQLHALNVDQAEADALVARWAASLKKSPGASELLTP